MTRRLALLFFILLLFELLPFCYMSFYVADRRFFAADISNDLYHPSAYYLSSVIASEPLLTPFIAFTIDSDNLMTNTFPHFGLSGPFISSKFNRPVHLANQRLPVRSVRDAVQIISQKSCHDPFLFYGWLEPYFVLPARAMHATMCPACPLGSPRTPRRWLLSWRSACNSQATGSHSELAARSAKLHVAALQASPS